MNHTARTATNLEVPAHETPRRSAGGSRGEAESSRLSPVVEGLKRPCALSNLAAS
jgi:hypothetical protein